MSRLIDVDEFLIDESEAYISAQNRINDSLTKKVNFVVHKKIQMLIADAPTVDAVDAETLMHIFGDDEPCNFNGWDDRTDDWCAEHCESHLPIECWRHAIQEKWWERREE